MLARQSVRLLLGLALVCLVLDADLTSQAAQREKRFVITAHGLTVTDTTKGLVWQRDGSGKRAGCSGAGGLYCTWEEAKAYCAGLSLDGTGWRLPTFAELHAIVDMTVASAPTINHTAFPNTPKAFFWTAEPCCNGSSGKAWTVHFGFGDSGSFDVGSSYDHDYGGFRVRCVR